ncbi:MAG: DUF423 domain-containing protein [Candidatus Omnitrophica bacterium]|nr:DUF423 domain-containing protein [Candidatus Omnitrophota bacterium]
MERQRFFWMTACLWGGLSVALGAFAAHGLRDRLEPGLLNAFEVGVRYQMYHALALLAASAGSAACLNSRFTSAACWAWNIGILLFSGSLYMMALTGVRWLGAITPIGGVSFMAGWALLFLAPIKRRSESE